MFIGKCSVIKLDLFRNVFNLLLKRSENMRFYGLKLVMLVVIEQTTRKCSKCNTSHFQCFYCINNKIPANLPYFCAICGYWETC